MASLLTPTIILGLETLIIIMVLVGGYYGRRLNMRWHHSLIYIAVVAQLILFGIWMLPGILFYDMTLILVVHATSGSITLLLSVYICIIFLKDKNQYDIPKLRHTKPLMIFTTYMWVITFILGIMVYLEFYIFTS